jgi:hypothetical protein
MVFKAALYSSTHATLFTFLALAAVLIMPKHVLPSSLFWAFDINGILSYVALLFLLYKNLACFLGSFMLQTNISTSFLFMFLLNKHTTFYLSINQ